MKLKINVLLTVAVLISGLSAQLQPPTQDFVTILWDAFQNKKNDIQITI